MNSTVTLRAFLASQPAALVTVAGAKGSTPREAGAWMLVSRNAIFGTIGGGQLEYMAIDEARRLVRGQVRDAAKLSIPLGPEIGQCCGGRVDLTICLVDNHVAHGLMDKVRKEEAASPHVYVFGGGHVGRALANVLALLPVQTIVVETREAELAGLPDGVEARLAAVPEDVVKQAPAGSAFLVLTHDHALDFLITAEALLRTDTAYVGMIGSKSKRTTFRNWFMKNAGGTESAVQRLISPIGGDEVKDKRPAVIAALAAAEVITALTACADASVLKRMVVSRL